MNLAQILAEMEKQLEAVGEEAETIETVAEPYLVREGFLVRTARGRMATAKAWEHLGLRPPTEEGTLDV